LGISLSDIVRTIQFLAFISWIEETFFSNNKSLGTNKTDGILESINANGQCFNSQLG
jgi:hypothetical protein